MSKWSLKEIAANVPVGSHTHELQGLLVECICDPDQSNQIAVLSVHTKRAGPPQMETTSDGTEIFDFSLQLLSDTDLTETDLPLATANTCEELCHAIQLPVPASHSSNGKLLLRDTFNILKEESWVLTTLRYLSSKDIFKTKPEDDENSLGSLVVLHTSGGGASSCSCTGWLTFEIDFLSSF
jgi:hypothetical protein